MTKYLSEDIRNEVAERANFVCEYCLVAEEDAYFKFQIEHIISRKHSGSSETDNLALACVFCNRHKGSDIASINHETDELLPFYNPRTMRWHEHFHLNGVRIDPVVKLAK